MRVVRTLVAAAWIGGQVVLVGTGPRRADGSFAFRMFPESSTIQIDLSREVVAESGQGTVRVPVENGRWLARDEGGTMHRFRWDERVVDGNLFPYGQPVHASYGAAAQVQRLALALDDVAAHIPEDDETVRLIADVTVRKNGGPPQHVELASRYRDNR
ncbi:MAG TPA: hypothetical protein VGH28_06770 [Polyangiaceae bacterium]|jgi:hypothetical protein